MVLPSCWNKEEEADYYCKTKKRQNVKYIAIVISEDNKIDYHCQSVALVGGLWLILNQFTVIESLDVIIQDVINYQG